LRDAGCFVPNNFQEFGNLIGCVYRQMVDDGIIIPVEDIEPPQVPVDFNWAKKIGMVRKSSTFMSSISDERGDELNYGGVPISDVLSQGMGIGGTIGLLWFRRQLPDYFCRFIETVLIVTADHGPAVSGAHNTIVTARAGKDLISSLVSGLLTIGPRFGGALDEAAKSFYKAHKQALDPISFVKQKRANKELIMGIGHKVKSLENPDKRVEIIVNFAKEHFTDTTILDFGLAVQAVTTRKKSNLILNVDGAIACCFLDLMFSCGCFSVDEAEQYIDYGVLNAMFVLGRSIGFIGHFLDQKRLNQGLYRHPTDDIAYLLGQFQ
jgi:ATP citrate (pro-S)-lyase